MHRFISARIRLAGIDTAHFGAIAVDTIEIELLRRFVAESVSVAEVLAKLGLPTEGRPHRRLSVRIRELGIDTAHFRGMGWARGETKRSSATVARISARRTRPDELVFVEDSPEMSGTRLARRLVALGWTYAGGECGLGEWRGQPLVLHVDHINGVPTDNRLFNLRLLCPNCHSQTDTYCGRNREATLAR
jgi:hypothetical protein